MRKPSAPCSPTLSGALSAPQPKSRLMIVHAISPAAEAFYLHHRFARLPVETPTLALDLIRLRRLAGEA